MFFTPNFKQGRLKSKMPRTYYKIQWRMRPLIVLSDPQTAKLQTETKIKPFSLLHQKIVLIHKYIHIFS